MDNETVTIYNSFDEDRFRPINKPGEINSLSKIVKPDIAVITNVAEAHIENFKNLLGIAKEKSSIIQNINDGGTIILNRSDRFFK